MKCWECKKEIKKAMSVPYVAVSRRGEAYEEKFRNIGYCCYDTIKKLFSNTCHIEVEKISQRKIKGGD